MANLSNLVIVSVIVVLGIMHSCNSQTTPTTTTPSARYQNCIENCQTTSQFNPVCGTDGETYHNEYRLRCAQRCGLAVELRRPGSCRSSAGGK